MLPGGIQRFRDLRKEGRHYVDKAGYVRELVESGSRYFLSRPRRFGKSLPVSTLESLFACERELFEGLVIEPRWNWSEPHPVVRLSFGSDEYDKPILDALDDPGIARTDRNYLQGLYAVIKDRDEHVRFCFLTASADALRRPLHTACAQAIAIPHFPAGGLAHLILCPPARP